MTNAEMVDDILKLFADNGFTIQESLKIVDCVKTDLRMQSEYTKVNMDTVSTARKQCKMELNAVLKELHEGD